VVNLFSPWVRGEHPRPAGRSTAGPGTANGRWGTGAYSVPRMTTTPVTAGPAVLGLELGGNATLTDDGWLVRSFRAAPGLDGPPGVLQGGFATGVTLAAARLADRFGAPATRLDARLHRPTPLGRDLEIRIRHAEAAACHRLETLEGDRLLVEAEVELAGHDPAPQVFDLAELATVALPEPRPQALLATCWVCGATPTHPHAQRMLPGWHDRRTVVCPWVADEVLGDGSGAIDPVVVAAMLACPTAWASFSHVEDRGDAVGLLAGYHLRFFRPAPVMEPLRVVARCDGVDGRRLHTRGALLDDDGVVYAATSALYVSVPKMPG
jgi:hypothetical protein